MADLRPPRLVVVSGCDARFYRAEYQLLRSLRRHPRAVERVIVYDLGLEPAQRSRLEGLGAGTPPVEVRSFRFDDYPPLARRLGAYAWKPSIVSAVVNEVRGSVLWLDSATIVLRELWPIAAHVASHGVYAPFGGVADVRELGHPTARAALGVVESELTWRLRAAGVVAFDGTSSPMRELAGEWARLGLREECIAPPGASLANHRFDQVILTLLVERASASMGLKLTADELDISSAHPTRLLTSRNKTRNGVPEWLDPLLWRFFALRRITNGLSNRIRGR